DGMRLLFALSGTQHAPIMSRHERLNELTFNNPMVACLADQMHIDEQILIIDGNFHPVPFLQIRQPLGLPNSHRHKSWLHFTRINPCLSPCHFQDRANEHTISSKKLMVSWFSNRSGLTDRCY